VTAWDPAATEFRVLGPVEAVRDGRSLPIGGPRQRALLALLLLENARPLATERLVDELWCGQPPARATETLRTYVSKLRSSLGRSVAITSDAGGYTIAVQAEQIDSCRFEHLVEAARAALARGAPGRAAERAAEALALWRGAPFSGTSDHDALRLEASRLEELRLAALETRIEAQLQLGGDGALIDELEALVRVHPYRERLWRQLMLALYRVQRQADALAAYRRARDVLDEELGLEPSEELKALEQAILRHEVPPPAPADERHNLPAPVSSFVGRENELADVERLLADHRLVTLTGVGGVGKTRLAVAAAERALPDFPDGARFVDLAPILDITFALQELCAGLGIDQSGTQPERLLAQRLRCSALLVVLDNCEHLLEAVADLVGELLSACPSLRVLATSREPLGVAGEVEYTVPPLGLPPADGKPDLLRSSEAVRLFCARAPGVDARLDDATLALVGGICRELDGLPLAIELAAGRAKALSLEEVAARLADRFRFLVSWRRLTPARHRTLREAMDWSYELLSADEQQLLAELSVFSGGFTLTAVAEVCFDGDSERALDALSRLIDASLVAPAEHEAPMRYSLLETVRQYAAERLREAWSSDRVRERHAQWCLALAERAEPELRGEQQTEWLETLDREHQNLRAAADHLAAAGRTELELQLAISLSRFWYVRGYLAEGRRRLEQALASTEASDPALRRRAFTAAASLALLQGDYPDAARLAGHALDAARAVGDDLYVANGLSNLGAIVLAAGDAGRARQLLEDAVALAREVGDERILALSVNNLGDLALTVGDYERAGPLFAESLELLRARGDTANIARSLFNLGAVALRLGNLDEAAARFRESIVFAEQAKDMEDLAWCLEGLAGVAAAEGRGEHAAVLLGAAGAVLERMAAEFKPFERQLHEETSTASLRLCGEELFREALRAGAELPLHDAVAQAVAGPVPV